MDKVHCCWYVLLSIVPIFQSWPFLFSNPWLVCFHNAFPSPVCCRRSRYRLLNRISWHCPSPLDKRSLLFCATPCPYILPGARFLLEIVRNEFTSRYLAVLMQGSYSYRRTYRPLSYHIAQELQKYNIPDYRPRQEQYVFLLSFLNSQFSYLSEDSKKQSRKFAPYNVCDGTVVLHSARQRMLGNKTKPSWFGLTIHPNPMQDRRVIRFNCYYARWTM